MQLYVSRLLDDEHRRTMLAEFMPQVAQQVIVLATTSEIDEPTFRFMQLAVARAYLMEADSAMAQVTEKLLAGPTAFIPADILTI
ncbi:MAG: hypothetical protein IAE79_00990 [Anaerolinea sp.]|nr:hypothetical protein [Anaerolinea sp.]